MEKEKKFEEVKVRFNHNEESISKAVGITDEKLKELLDYQLKKISEGKDITQQLEDIFNDDKFSQLEKYFLSFLVGSWFMLKRENPMPVIFGVIKIRRNMFDR